MGLANPIDISGEYSIEAFKDGPSSLGESSEFGGIPAFNDLVTNEGYRGPFKQLRRLRGNTGPTTVNPFNSPLRKLNTLCYRGMSIAVIRNTRERRVTLSTDHWGTNVYQGCRGARTGAMAF